MKNSTEINSINLREAIARNRRLLISRKRPEVRVWTPYLMLGLFFTANWMLIAVLRLFGN